MIFIIRSMIKMNVYKCVYCGTQEFQKDKFNELTYLCKNCYTSSHMNRINTVERECIICHKTEQTKLINCPPSAYKCRKCHKDFVRKQIMAKEMECHEMIPVKQPEHHDCSNELVKALRQLNQKLEADNKMLISKLQNYNETYDHSSELVKTLQQLNHSLGVENRELTAKLQDIDKLKKENDKLKKEIGTIPSLKCQIEVLTKQLYDVEHTSTFADNVKLKLRIKELEKANKEQKDLIDVYEFRRNHCGK